LLALGYYISVNLGCKKFLTVDVRIYCYIILTMQFIKTDSAYTAAKHISKTIEEHLSKGEKVLWLIAGGSAIKVAAHINKNLADKNVDNLLITLTDERFVPAGDPDSNWQQLLEADFNAGGAKVFPILDNSGQEETADKYDKLLKRLILQADYKIALFGMGPDGHIAALFPGYPQLHEKEYFAVSFNNSPKPPSGRLTMTFEAIKNLDEAVIFATGEEKRIALEKLMQQNSVDELPAQFLKNLSKLTIFNDQTGEKV
jgi:6-phosphogluconolactonase